MTAIRGDGNPATLNSPAQMRATITTESAMNY
jgi:hypothetical protein